MRKWTKLGSGLGIAAVATLALAIPAASASAATASPASTASSARAQDSPGYLTVCDYGDYGINVSFPDRGGLGYSPFFGQCGTVYLGGSQNEQVNVYTDTGAYVGSTIYNGLRGETIVGISGPSFYAY
jgi:hypothetical protein